MRKTRLALFAVLVGLASSSVLAQTTSFERILVPIVISGELPGAFGSRWVTHLAVTNTADDRVMIFGYSPYPSGCVVALCPPVPPTPAHITFFPIVTPGETSQGAIIHVDRQLASKVRFQLRVQDVSRQATTWGTEIPVVREADVFTDKFQLLDVPLTAGFRATLRLYDIDALGNAQAAVRFFRFNPSLRSPLDILFDPNIGPAQPDVLLTERSVILPVERRSQDPTFDIGYAEISNLASLPELHAVDRVRIEIQPTRPGLRLWGFVSVTNDDTQHVTTVTPH